MRIATYNVNGVNGRLPVLLRWLDETGPDVVCLQELKAPDERFPVAAIEAAGYEAIWYGQKSWNGVAILSRVGPPVETRGGLPGDADDVHSRYIEAAVNGVIVAGLYLPNVNPRPGPKFDYNLRWFERLIDHAAELVATGVPVVIAGVQCDAHDARRLEARALARRRAVRARGPRRLRPTARSRVDRCATRDASRRDHLHLLGLFPERL